MLGPAAAQDHLRDPHHAYTQVIVFGSSLRITLESNEWFTWLAAYASFAFVDHKGHLTVRREDQIGATLRRDVLDSRSLSLSLDRLRPQPLSDASNSALATPQPQWTGLVQSPPR